MVSIHASARVLGLLLLSAGWPAMRGQPAPASGPVPVLTQADYARAERLVGYNANPLVDHAVNAVAWLDDTHFWYRDHDAVGDRFVQMDARSGKTSPSFDAAKLAAALAKAGGKPVDASKLPLTQYRVQADGGFSITAAGKRYLCDAAFMACTAAKNTPEPGVPSPHKRSEVFVRDWNLWLRDLASGKQTQLTHDGVVDYGYAT